VLVAAVRARPEAPLMTYYDGRTGERVELSGTTFMNWVAKSANLLRDSIGLPPEPAVALALPAHWQTVALVHAVWALGGSVITQQHDPAFAAADLLVRAADDTGLANPALDDAAHDDVMVLAFRPLAAPGQTPAAHLWDYDREVRTGGDTFSGASADPRALALVQEGAHWSQADVVASVAARGTDAQRFLVGAARDAGESVLTLGLAAALGRGVVLAVDTDDAQLQRIADQERAVVRRLAD
jgi:uncharacterized protein (TIGR03089 family)